MCCFFFISFNQLLFRYQPSSNGLHEITTPNMWFLCTFNANTSMLVTCRAQIQHHTLRRPCRCWAKERNMVLISLMGWNLKLQTERIHTKLFKRLLKVMPTSIFYLVAAVGINQRIQGALIFHQHRRICAEWFHMWFCSRCPFRKTENRKGEKKRSWKTFLDVAAVCKTQEEAEGKRAG